MPSALRRLLEAKQKNDAADATLLGRQIGQHAYTLDGLTPEKIKVVEGWQHMK